MFVLSRSLFVRCFLFVVQKWQKMKKIAFIGLFVLAVLWFILHYALPQASNAEKALRRENNTIRKRSVKYRLAVVIPFVGDGPSSIPPYLNLFCAAARGSAPLVDFLLIHNGALDDTYIGESPENVYFINLGSTEALAEKLAKVLDGREVAKTSPELLAKILAKHILQYPYALVEFKPAFGHIFDEYLRDYSHWAYSDLDIAFGDLPRWITNDELENFDIVTYGFGDQDRVYLRGQFTFHKVSWLVYLYANITSCSSRFRGRTSFDPHPFFL